MKKLSFEKFTSQKIQLNHLKNIQGGKGSETSGGDYFFGYGKSTCDWNPNDGKSCTYYFEDGRQLSGDCK